MISNLVTGQGWAGYRVGMNTPWEYIWVGLVLSVVGGVLVGAGLGFLDPRDPIGFFATLGGLGLVALGGIVAGIGVIAEGVRLGSSQGRAQQWASPRVDQTTT